MTALSQDLRPLLFERSSTLRMGVTAISALVAGLLSVGLFKWLVSGPFIENFFLLLPLGLFVVLCVGSVAGVRSDPWTRVQVFADGAVELRFVFFRGARTWRGRVEVIEAVGHSVDADDAKRELREASEAHEASEGSSDDLPDRTSAVGFRRLAFNTWVDVRHHGRLWLGHWKKQELESLVRALGRQKPEQAIEVARGSTQTWSNLRRIEGGGQ